MGQGSSLKIKVAVLKYLQDLLVQMEPVDMRASEDLRYAVCKIVSFTAEPKSQDIRRSAQAVLVALFNLNTPEFSALLNELPKNIQETASRILKSHIKNCTQENGGGANGQQGSPTQVKNANGSFSTTDYKYICV